MARLASQPVSLQCPVCGAPIRAEVRSLVDVGQEPELKGQFLRGRLNVARCSNCGGEGIVAAPLMYHDPDKELLLVLVPPESQLKDQEQQQLIGQLTNVVMSYLPPEKRKAYLLLPKVLLSYQSLLETVLQAEGITPEMVAAQRTRLDLVERLLGALADDDALRAVVAQVDDQIDEEFFATLAAYLGSYQQDGHVERAEILEKLRARLLELSTHGRELAARMLDSQKERPTMTREELLEKMLVAPSEEELSSLVAWYRSAVDYAFYQMLTERIENAGREGRSEDAGRMRELRENLLSLTERMDREAQAALEKGTELLRLLLESPDAEKVIRERLGEFDDAFFIVLGANLKAAEEAGREDIRERLQQLGNLVLGIAQEKLPPEVRLIRQLLVTPDPAAVATVLQQNETLVTEDLLLLIRDLADEVEDDGTAARLRQLAEQAEAWLRERQA
jgi:hypothetical protein